MAWFPLKSPGQKDQFPKKKVQEEEEEVWSHIVWI